MVDFQYFVNLILFHLRLGEKLQAELLEKLILGKSIIFRGKLLQVDKMKITPKLQTHSQSFFIFIQTMYLLT